MTVEILEDKKTVVLSAVESQTPPVLHFSLGNIEPQQVPQYLAIAEDFRKSNFGVGIYIYTPGQEMPEGIMHGKSPCVPDDKVYVLFMEEKPGALDSRFFGKLYSQLQRPH